MDELAKKLNIADPVQWKTKSTHTLQQNGAYGMLNRYNSMGHLLTTVYPEYKQACRDFVLNVVRDLKLNSVKDILTVPIEYLQDGDTECLLENTCVLIKNGIAMQAIPFFIRTQVFSNKFYTLNNSHEVTCPRDLISNCLWY